MKKQFSKDIFDEKDFPISQIRRNRELEGAPEQSYLIEFFAEKLIDLAETHGEEEVRDEAQKQEFGWLSIHHS